MLYRNQKHVMIQIILSYISDSLIFKATTYLHIFSYLIVFKNSLQFLT